MHIALHDGFNGQTVTISVNGREVYRRSGVRTDLRISRADAFETEVPQGTAEISVSVEPGGLNATTRIDTTANPYLALDVYGGGIRFKPSNEPFHYM